MPSNRARRVRIWSKMWSIKDVPDVAAAAREPRYARRGLDGICIYDDRSILIDQGLRPKGRLVVLAHEILHAACPKLSEQQVVEASTAIGSVLWREGWRVGEES